MTLTRSALPQRSPMPLMVPCTCVAPWATAASELATATSQSLWQWMPSSTRSCAAHRRDGGGDVVGQRAAVGVAQDDDRGAGVLGRSQRLQGVLGVVPVAVEEVLGVVEDLAAGLAAVGHRIGDHAQVLFQRGAEHFADVQVPGLADDGDDRRLGVEQRLEAGVVGRLDALAARHAEGGDAGVPQRQLADFLEILEVLGVGQRIAALDEVHAQLVEPARDVQLVLQGEVDALALAAVAQGGVVDVDARHE